MLKGFIYVLILVVTGMFSFSAGEIRGIEEAQHTAKNQTVTRTAQALPNEDTVNFTDIVEGVLPTVVGIEATSGRYRQNSTVSLGSGVIVSDKGYIVTNQHVVGDNPYRIDVTLFDGNVCEGELCWSDKTLDVAVVKIYESLPAVAAMGEYKNVRVGEDVFAIGNPLSLQFERSVTKGIVSAVNRTITLEDDGETVYMEDLIQTDASINPGNSGGPLMNTRGEVIGINTIRVQSAEGMGFAVPINICESVISALELKGEFETPYLGMYAYTSQTARYLKQEDNARNGLFVISLDTQGPCYKAGIKYGDMITHINSVGVSTMLELRRELFKYEPGEKISLTVISQKKEKQVEVSIGAMNNNIVGSNQ